MHSAALECPFILVIDIWHVGGFLLTLAFIFKPASVRGWNVTKALCPGFSFFDHRLKHNALAMPYFQHKC